MKNLEHLKGGRGWTAIYFSCHGGRGENCFLLADLLKNVEFDDSFFPEENTYITARMLRNENC